MGMAEQKIKLRVLLGCADRDLAYSVVRRMEGKRYIEIVGWSDDGEEILRLCEQVPADLVVLDTELSGVDGLTIAFRLRERGSRQDLLMISTFQGAQLLTACNLLDVAYVLRKPIKPETLYDHLRLRAVVAEAKVQENEETRSLQKGFSKFLHDFHLQSETKYGQYVGAVICFCRNNNSGLTKEVYPEVARQFGTTPANIERSIRYLAQKVWDCGDTEKLKQYFGEEIACRGVRPSNMRFIQAVLDYLQ